MKTFRSTSKLTSEFIEIHHREFPLCGQQCRTISNGKLFSEAKSRILCWNVRNNLRRRCGIAFGFMFFNANISVSSLGLDKWNVSLGGNKNSYRKRLQVSHVRQKVRNLSFSFFLSLSLYLDSSEINLLSQQTKTIWTVSDFVPSIFLALPGSWPEIPVVYSTNYAVHFWRASLSKLTSWPRPFLYSIFDLLATTNYNKLNKYWRNYEALNWVSMQLN